MEELESQDLLQENPNKKENENEEVDKLIAAPFENQISDQNCFVNVILHCLHYTSAIEKFLLEEDFSNNEQYHFLSELQKIIDKYRQLTSQIFFKKIPSNLRFINPKEIRSELDYLFKESKLFQLGSIGEPSEVFYVIISALHNFCAGEDSILAHSEEECKLDNCSAHQTFYIDIAEQIECKNCNAKSDIMKFPSYTYMFDINPVKILNIIDKMQYLDEFKGKLFEFTREICTNVKGDSIEIQKKKICDEGCENPQLSNNIILISKNSYLCFSLAWEDQKPKIADICKLVFTIPEVFKNSDLFEIYDHLNIRKYYLYGMICYCDNHHIAFYLKRENIITYWVYHNDMEIQVINSYKDVLSYCIKNRYYPKILFYKEVDDPFEVKLFLKETDITDADFFRMFNHALKIDLQNATSYKNEESPKGKIRNFSLTKASDEKLLKTLEAMKKIPDNRMRKFRILSDTENDDSYIQTSLSNRKTSEDLHNIYSNDSVANKTMQTAETKRNIIDENVLKEEEFRMFPYENKGEWKCRNKNCGNINNSSTFECFKCKAIDMEAFEMIENLKEDDSSYILTPSQSGKIKGKGKMKKTGSSKRFLVVEGNDMKKCLNCGRPFKTGCEFCKLGPMKTFQKIKDENPEAAKFSNNSITSRKRNLTGREAKNKYMWLCNFCKTNNMRSTFCKNCKRNKPL